MSITLISVFVLAILIIASLLIGERDPRSLAVFRNLAPRYRGVVKGRYLYPRLIFPLRGSQAQLSHHWSRRAAAGGQLVFRQKFLIFGVSAEHLRHCVDVIIYTRIGWTTMARQVGFERYITADAAFDEKFVIFTRDKKDKVTALLNEDLRQKTISLKENTAVLEIEKVKQIFRIKYQKHMLESEQVLEAILQQFLAIYRLFEDTATAGQSGM